LLKQKLKATKSIDFVNEGQKLKILSAFKDNIANVFSVYDQAKTIEVKETKSDKMVYDINNSFVTFS